MKFSAQEEYGLRCLIQIAKSADSITISEISRTEGLSPTHVAKLLMILRKGGFITSTRGQAGGYVLSREPGHIIVGDVLASLGGRLYDGDFCGRHKGQLSICRHAIDCSVKSLWQVVQTAVDDVVQHITLADLLETKEAEPVKFYVPGEDVIRLG